MMRFLAGSCPVSFPGHELPAVWLRLRIPFAATELRAEAQLLARAGTNSWCMTWIATVQSAAPGFGHGKAQAPTTRGVGRGDAARIRRVGRRKAAIICIHWHPPASLSGATPWVSSGLLYVL